MAEEKPKNKGGRPRLTEEERELRAVDRELRAINVSTEENDMYIGHAWAALSRPAVDLSNLEEVEKRVTEYVISCRNTGIKPNPPALAAWLGITSSDLTAWLTAAESDDHKRTAARIYQFLHQSFVDMALSGKASPQVVVFLAKNWFGYTDAQRIEATTVEKAKTIDELAKEAAALPDGDIIDAEIKEVKKKKKK